jgi:hypothetical protein
MKYFLILYIFTLNGNEQLGTIMHNLTYPTYHSCISDGYIRSFTKLMEIDEKIINEKKILITFKCEEQNGISS